MTGQDVKHTASEAVQQLVHSPKAQGAISAGLATLGGYNLVEAAQSILSIVSLVIGIIVGIFAIINARKASKKADMENLLLELEMMKKVSKAADEKKPD